MRGGKEGKGGNKGTDADGRLTYCFARLEINLPDGRVVTYISGVMYRNFFDNLEFIKPDVGNTELLRNY